MDFGDLVIGFDMDGLLIPTMYAEVAINSANDDTLYFASRECLLCHIVRSPSLLQGHSTKISNRSLFSRSCRSNTRPVAPLSMVCNRSSKVLLLSCGMSLAPRRKLALI